MSTKWKGKKWLMVGGLLVCASLMNRAAVWQTPGDRSAETIFSHVLPTLNGGKLAAHVVEVTYGPGAASPPHGHPCPVIGYVMQGSLRTQVKGQPEAVYKAGESFYEAPNGVHLISANASNTEPAKLLAFFVCDHDAPLSAPVKEERQ